MRILLVGAEFGMTGAGLMLFHYGAHLARSGHEVIVVPRAGETGPLQSDYESAGIRQARGETIPVTDDMIAICNTLMSAPDVMNFAAHMPTVWWLHEGEIGVDIIAQTPSIARAFGQAHRIVCPTAILRDKIYASFLLHVPSDRVVIIPYGVDPSPMPGSPRVPGPIRVVIVGSIYPRKRPLDLLRALLLLPDLDIGLHFVGRNHHLEPEFDALAGAAGSRVILHGEISNALTMKVLDEADVFALPSASESFGIAAIEAGMRAVPSVLSDLPAYEGIWRHGQNCLMHGVGDVALLAHMLLIFATDAPLRHRLGAAARTTAIRFRSDLMMARLDIAIAAMT